MGKTALITGITGQDGSYLAEFLLAKDYEVYGLLRRSSTTNTWRIDHLLDSVTLIDGDLLDQNSLISAMQEAGPDEIYNLAAQSFVATSWQQPTLTSEITGIGVQRMLEAMRLVVPHARFYQASSSEMFGNAPAPQSESTPFHPRSPYGVAKVFAHHAAVNYRESYGMHISSGILFNHESPRRGPEFVTRKITLGIRAILRGEATHLRLGNLEACRDWGFAGDYVSAMWMMLQQERPDDYVIATGETHSVEQFVAQAFAVEGLNWDDFVIQDETLYRPAEVPLLLGDATKARNVLGWSPTVSFDDLVWMMVHADTGGGDGKEGEGSTQRRVPGAT